MKMVDARVRRSELTAKNSESLGIVDWILDDFGLSRKDLFIKIRFMSKRYSIIPFKPLWMVINFFKYALVVSFAYILIVLMIVAFG